ncbi:alpha/beta-hydrolase [Viridothelium virens]|uniref:Alpha/beta-hydrolase n=1 Tax=Viridothelium virens TaxID=1048519 RepID=A0A6A6HBS8_VIRVR|nr:alpha/beta-hydrolase [Viridothelium virens]
MATVEEQKKLVRAIARSFGANTLAPISETQRRSSLDKPGRGPVWISRNVFAAPSESSIRDALYQVIEQLKEEYHIITPAEQTPILDVGVEFIGPRQGVASDAPEPQLPEVDKLRALEDECENDLTILYIHGGGLYFGHPSDYRAASARLARMTKSRIASIKYRLVPQNTFPAPILDALIAYASLLYPPPNAPYSPASPNRVIFAGNSSGANLCFALTKFLLEFQKLLNSDILFHGRRVALPLPGGVTDCSGWCDLCDSMPSWHTNGANDFVSVLQPACQPSFPTDNIWPSNPPREHTYCRAATLDHELVTPAAVRDWTGAPPMFFLCGCEERGIDGNRVIAAQAARSGVAVDWNEYEGMLHEFPIITAKLPQAKHAFGLWANACLNYASGKEIQSRSTKWLMPDCTRYDLGPPSNLLPLESHEEIRRRMKIYNSNRPIWTGRLSDPKL